ncbi:hypothetical protein [Moorena sp. SIOASIH]|nr:hypothetical protein [Moorena sp. SIOASIH]
MSKGKTFRSTIGEEIIIPAGEPHTFKSVGNVASRGPHGGNCSA